MRSDSRSQTKPRSPKTRDRILIESGKLFSKQGYIGTSTREIAEAVDISQPGVYRHFDSKAEIAIALGSAILDPLIEIAEREKELGNSSLIEFSRFFRGMCYELAYSNYSAQFFVSGQYLSEFRGVGVKYRHLTRYLEKLIRQGVISNEFREVPVVIAQETIMSLTDIVIFPMRGKLKARIEHAVEVAVRGLVADPSRSEAALSESYFPRPTWLV